MFQHPDKENMGIGQERYPLSKSNRQISKLPSFYTSVPVVVASKNLHVPKLTNLTKLAFTLDLIKENRWCRHVCDVISRPINKKDAHEVGGPCIISSIS